MSPRLCGSLPSRADAEVALAGGDEERRGTVVEHRVHGGPGGAEVPGIRCACGLLFSRIEESKYASILRSDSNCWSNVVHFAHNSSPGDRSDSYFAFGTSRRDPRNQS